MLAAYWTQYYVNRFYGYIFISGNHMIAAMVPLLFLGGSLRRARSWAALAGWEVLSWCGMELCGAVLQALWGDAGAQPYVGGTVLVLAAVLLTRRQALHRRLALALGYLGGFPVTLGITMTVGTLRVEEDLALEQSLIQLNLILLLVLTLLFRQLARAGEPHPGLLPVLGVVAAACYVEGLNGMYRFLPTPPYIALAYCLILLVLLVALYYVTFALPRWLHESTQRQAERFLHQASENTLAALRANLEHYNRVRHDMKNQYLYMQALLDAGRYADLRAYWDRYADQLVPPQMTIACENQTIAIILNMEAAKAAQAGVTLQPNVLAPGRLQISDTDLCSLLVNLMDNAIEYLARHPDLKPRTVDVEVRAVQRSLILTVRNPLRPEDARDALALSTRKANRQLHGYGSRIVASLARQYDGAVYYEAPDGYFVARVILTQPAADPGPAQKEA